MDADQLAALGALANGIIPADEVDDGAAAVNAGPRLAERIQAGIQAALYREGLESARTVATEEYGREVNQLSPAEVATVLAVVREKLPAFFAQLRMDVSALYLSDPGVWRRIGFPGPSTKSGGYPDYDQTQTQTIVQLKE
jgi:Gluconate 2-dehydrogenase subunit 3